MKKHSGRLSNGRILCLEKVYHRNNPIIFGWFFWHIRLCFWPFHGNFTKCSPSSVDVRLWSSEIPDIKNVSITRPTVHRLWERMLVRQWLDYDPEAGPQITHQDTKCLKNTQITSVPTKRMPWPLLGPTSSRGYQETQKPKNSDSQGWQPAVWLPWLANFVGSAFTDSGEEYGVQLMFWRYSLRPQRWLKWAGLSDLARYWKCI